MVKISSKNQKGGITAQNVNTTINNQEKPTPSPKKLIAIFTGLIGFIAAVLGILQFFDISIF